ncbi:hypothetical protein RA27_10805 [Ruegeria sp. ANG-R]|nr:hypothetical protein RA27_10805 [Ruegeria sp. ANG-R]
MSAKPAPRWLILFAAKERFESHPSKWLSMTALAASAAMQRQVCGTYEQMLRQQTQGTATAVMSAFQSPEPAAAMRSQRMSAKQAANAALAAHVQGRLRAV